MAIFNATPDSFSDGSTQNLDLDSALSSITTMLSSPYRPDILDIGGMSTRPGSTPCTETEELDRVIPLIQAIRARKEWAEVMISVDTYRPNVARKAVEAGANLLNDVRGGREVGMLDVVSELGVPYVMMHSRGDSSTMTSPESQTYGEGVVDGVKRELGVSIGKALERGVRGWDIILDPGIGFAKSPSQSLDLLKNVDQLRSLSHTNSRTVLDGNADADAEVDAGRYPLLVGASRKGFVGKVTGRTEPQDRGWGDSVVNALCVVKGVEILRVHDWRGARESVGMAKALFGGYDTNQID
jgi:dihydroneopterin aldolase/2-amino-4-hydroxy-6-hydroxymethyldihydropteridine diphosphokinase/dihydropteroate synthase